MKVFGLLKTVLFIFTLQKLSKGQTWLAALKNHVQMDPLGHEEDKKRLMLERFQEEHPGFDFSAC